MTTEKLKSVFQFYRSYYDEKFPKIGPNQLTNVESQYWADHLSTNDKISHFKFMCDEAQSFADQGRVEKAMRWLGFLQGVLWMSGRFNLDDLKKHSMP